MGTDEERERAKEGVNKPLPTFRIINKTKRNQIQLKRASLLKINLNNDLRELLYFRVLSYIPFSEFLVLSCTFLLFLNN